MNNIDISIIIVNFKTKELTKNCISSLLKFHPSISLEVIVVDNNSGDGSVEYLQTAFPNIITISLHKNFGFGYGNNIGVQNANGKYILLLNSDTIVIKNIITPFIEFYNAYRNVNIGVLGSLMTSEDFNAVHSFGNFPSLLRSHIGKNINRNELIIINKIETNYYAEVNIVSGANMFMEKDVFDRFNGFDTNIFLYEEEMELQYRMNKMNLKSIVINEKGIVHLEGKSSSNYYKRKQSFLSLCYVMKKHLPYYTYCYYRVIRTIYAIIFFKNPRITLKEKIDYLKLTLKKNI
jgi:GT2 family glycosyltransferase